MAVMATCPSKALPTVVLPLLGAMRDRKGPAASDREFDDGWSLASTACFCCRSVCVEPCYRGRVRRLAVDLYTGVSKVPLAEELCDELVARLDGFAAPEAARHLRDCRSVRQEDKLVVREVLSRWRHSLGTTPLAEQLWELQTELGRGHSHSCQAN